MGNKQESVNCNKNKDLRRVYKLNDNINKQSLKNDEKLAIYYW